MDDTELPEDHQVEHDGVDYSLCVVFHEALTFDNPRVTLFFRSFINQALVKTGLRRVRGGKYFDPENYKRLEGANMFAAYFNTMKTVDGVIYLNLNPSVKFF